MAIGGFLKQSTAVTLVLGPFVDATDGATAETALTISQADVRLSKNAGAFAQKGDATSCTHMENGLYSCPLSTTDTGTLGILTVHVNEAGALPVRLDFLVVPANVYDSLVGGSDALDVSLIQWLGAAPNALVSSRVDASVGAMASAVMTAAAIAPDAIGASELAADAVTEIQSGLATAAALATVQADTDNIQTRLPAALVGGRMDASLGAVVAGLLPVKKNTALSNFPFVMVDSADHLTPKTGLTVTAQRGIDGGALAACANSVVEVSNGIYKINLAASDLNGDTIILRFTAASADATLIPILTQ